MDRRSFTCGALAACLARPGFANGADPQGVGVQFADADDGHVHMRHGGMATTQATVTPETLFQVASCSKIVNALTIMTMVRDGFVELDMPANRYLRRWKLGGPRGEIATIAELLSHTAGTTVGGFDGYGPGEDIPSLLDILEGRPPANSDAIRTRHRVFSRYRYSGGGTTVLQALIEDVTQTPFARYAHEKVLSAVGAQGATFALRPHGPIAHGIFEDGQPVPGGFRIHPESAAAGLWATASDLVRLLQSVLHALQRRRNALLPHELALRMINPVVDDVALGLFRYSENIILHDGRNEGFDSIVMANLQTGRVRAGVANRNGALQEYFQQILPPS